MLVTSLGSFLFTEDLCTGFLHLPTSTWKGAVMGELCTKAWPSSAASPSALLREVSSGAGSSSQGQQRGIGAGKSAPGMGQTPGKEERGFEIRHGGNGTRILGVTWAEGWAHTWCRADFLRPRASAAPMVAEQCPGDSPEASGSAPEGGAPGLVFVPQPSSGSWSSLT